MRTVVKRLRAHMAFGGALLIALALTIVSQPVHARAVIDPISILPVGMVVEQTPMTLPTELQSIATGKRITYVSTNIRNQKIAVTGAIITPKNQPVGSHTVAWAHGTTGLGDQCTPSTNLDVFWPEAVSAVKSYLQKGWTVAATDYPGLGTPQPHPYLVGESEARSVIDSVRAARFLNPLLSNKWAVTGHSQGGQAALFAGEIADTYANGLSLKGVVAMAPGSNVDIISEGIIGTPGQGLLVAGILGLAAVDPTVDPNTILAQPAKNRLGVFQTGCYYEILEAFATLTPTQLVVGGTLPQSLRDKLGHYGNPGQQASVAPILITQGTADAVVPVDLTYLLQVQVCAYTTPVYVHVVEGADHEGSVFQTLAEVTNYLHARFGGLPAPDNC